MQLSRPLKLTAGTKARLDGRLWLAESVKFPVLFRESLSEALSRAAETSHGALPRLRPLPHRPALKVCQIAVDLVQFNVCLGTGARGRHHNVAIRGALHVTQMSRYFFPVSVDRPEARMSSGKRNGRETGLAHATRESIIAPIAAELMRRI